VPLKTKSVGSPIEPDDGLRLLVTRFRGRGMQRSRYDEWIASLGPSEQLLKAFLAKKISWGEFSREYREQMFQPAPVDAENATIKNHGQKFTLRLIKRLAREGNVTLMCHCAEQEAHCHRHLLQRIILSKRV
jgi:uncharacterized protein YeaO (DUF488 family)